MCNKLMLQEKRKVATVHNHNYVVRYNIICNYMFYIAIWPLLLLVVHYIVDEVSEIDHFGEILITIEFSQVVNQL